MTEHVGPISDQLINSAADGLESRYSDSFESTFFPQNVQYGSGIGSKIVVAKKVDHVVEITRSCAFCERTHFFPEDLFIGVTPSRDTTFGQIAIRMSDGSI